MSGEIVNSLQQRAQWNGHALAFRCESWKIGDLRPGREARDEIVKMMYTFLVGGEYEQTQKLTDNEIRYAEY
jgi:hypothetical protein